MQRESPSALWKPLTMKPRLAESALGSRLSKGAMALKLKSKGELTGWAVPGYWSCGCQSTEVRAPPMVVMLTNGLDWTKPLAGKKVWLAVRAPKTVVMNGCGEIADCERVAGVRAVLAGSLNTALATSG